MCGLTGACPEKFPASSRRKRLWELDEKCYCPLVGVCFEVSELRRLLGRAANLPGKTSDYEVHVTAVRLCEKRTPFAEQLQRELEKRYVLALKRFRTAKTPDQLLALWREALHGTQVRGALWAVWTHPQCDAVLNQQVYADIHMLQHQLGSAQRREQKQMQALEQENLQLAEELATMQQRFTAFRAEKAGTVDSLVKQLQGRNEEILRLGAEVQRLKSMAENAGHPARLLHDLALAQQRLLQSEARLREQAACQTELAAELAESRKENARLEDELRGVLLANAVQIPCVPGKNADLAGRCVLCVGGRTGAIDIYRGMVERLGGKFVHHDGGVEESFHRLESNISCADAVICQAGCINHNAYWLVKDLCKKTGKPCFYAKKPSVSAFLGGLNTLFRPMQGAVDPQVLPDS